MSDRTTDYDLSLAESAVLIGRPALGPRVRVSFGAVLHSRDADAAQAVAGEANRQTQDRDANHEKHQAAHESVAGLSIGADSIILENCVLSGSARQPCVVGRKTVFGHRALVVGARVGDLCEIGNGVILMPGASLGDRCILGEGTLVPGGMQVPDDSVVVGRPAKAIRRLNESDRAMLARMRGGDISLDSEAPRRTAAELAQAGAALSSGHHERVSTGGNPMQNLHTYRDRAPQVDASAKIFASAELLGDVTVGANSVIGPGVKIIGDSHGPVRIGRDVQILSNSVLHLLPDNELLLEDGVVIGPGAMIHGCRIGRGSVIEPGAIVCDNSVIGAESIVRAGALVKQRANFPERSVLEGFPAKAVEQLSAAPPRPDWSL